MMVSLRDQFAMAAMQGILANEGYHPESIANKAYAVANRMMEKRGLGDAEGAPKSVHVSLLTKDGKFKPGDTVPSEGLVYIGEAPVIDVDGMHRIYGQVDDFTAKENMLSYGYIFHTDKRVVMHTNKHPLGEYIQAGDQIKLNIGD